MEIIGRITADAKISETKAGKKVMNFSIAINDIYKTKYNSVVKKLLPTLTVPTGLMKA